MTMQYSKVSGPYLIRHKSVSYYGLIHWQNCSLLLQKSYFLPFLYAIFHCHASITGFICFAYLFTIRKIKTIPKDAGYATKTIQKLIHKMTTRYNRIQPAQKEIKFKNSISFIKGISLKLERELKNLEGILPSSLIHHSLG